MPLRDVAARFTRELSLATAAVLLLGLGAAGQVPAAARPETITLSSQERPAERPAAPPVALAPPRPRPQTARIPARIPARPAARWLPTGTGMWIHEWGRTEKGHAPKVVARAKAAGLTHVFVRTGSSADGWTGQRVLSQLLPATRGTDLQVVAWDFPTLVHPENDARRLAKAAWWRRPGVPMVAAVAPDIETLAEGTHATASSINRYYRTLRKALPARVAILSTVPWPSKQRINRYPYTRTARYADAFLPMAYWYNNSPSRVTARSMAVLRRFGKPVFPVGQGYDGRLDAPYLPPDRTPGRSVDAFVAAARASGARSISLWSWQTTGAQQWRALHRASKRYAVPPRPGGRPRR